LENFLATFQRRTTPEFNEEIFQKENVVLLLRPSSLGWRQCHDALSIWSEIDVPSDIDRSSPASQTRTGACPGQRNRPFGTV
jgi:hypothetical protein